MLHAQDQRERETATYVCMLPQTAVKAALKSSLYSGFLDKEKKMYVSFGHLDDTTQAVWRHVVYFFTKVLHIYFCTTGIEKKKF